jgi:hypothetical protein
MRRGSDLLPDGGNIINVRRMPVVMTRMTMESIHTWERERGGWKEVNLNETKVIWRSFILKMRV